MALGDEESEQRQRFAEALRHAEVSLEELWLRYFTIGGHEGSADPLVKALGQFEVEAYIHGAMALPSLQRDILAHALNERLDELHSGAPRAPYSVDASEKPADDGPDGSPAAGADEGSEYLSGDD